MAHCEQECYNSLLHYCNYCTVSFTAVYLGLILSLLSFLTALFSISCSCHCCHYCFYCSYVTSVNTVIAITLVTVVATLSSVSPLWLLSLLSASSLSLLCLVSQLYPSSLLYLYSITTIIALTLVPCVYAVFSATAVSCHTTSLCYHYPVSTPFGSCCLLSLLCHYCHFCLFTRLFSHTVSCTTALSSVMCHTLTILLRLSLLSLP